MFITLHHDRHCVAVCWCRTRTRHKIEVSVKVTLSSLHKKVFKANDEREEEGKILIFNASTGSAKTLRQIFRQMLLLPNREFYGSLSLLPSRVNRRTGTNWTRGRIFERM